MVKDSLGSVNVTKNQTHDQTFLQHRVVHAKCMDRLKNKTFAPLYKTLYKVDYCIKKHENYP